MATAVIAAPRSVQCLGIHRLTRRQQLWNAVGLIDMLLSKEAAVRLGMLSRIRICQETFHIAKEPGSDFMDWALKDGHPTDFRGQKVNLASAAKKGNFVANAFLACQEAAIKLVVIHPTLAKVAVSVLHQRARNTDTVKSAIQDCHDAQYTKDLQNLHEQWYDIGPQTAETANASALHLKWISEGGIWLNDNVFRSIIKARTGLLWTGERKARLFATTQSDHAQYKCPYPTCNVDRTESLFHRFTPTACNGTTSHWQEIIAKIIRVVAAKCPSTHSHHSHHRARRSSRLVEHYCQSAQAPTLPDYETIDTPHAPHLCTWDEKNNRPSFVYVILALERPVVPGAIESPWYAKPAERIHNAFKPRLAAVEEHRRPIIHVLVWGSRGNHPAQISKTLTSLGIPEDQRKLLYLRVQSAIYHSVHKVVTDMNIKSSQRDHATEAPVR